MSSLFVWICIKIIIAFNLGIAGSIPAIKWQPVNGCHFYFQPQLISSFVAKNKFALFFRMYPAVGVTGCAHIGFKNAGID